MTPRRRTLAAGLMVLLAGCSSGAPRTQPPSSAPATFQPALTTVVTAPPQASDAATPSPEAATATPAASEPIAAGGLVAYGWKNRIVVLNPDGSGTHELLPDVPGVQRPIGWSADGSRLLYVTSPAYETSPKVGVVDPAGRSPAQYELPCPMAADGDPVLASCQVDPDGGLALAPDGTRVAYTVLQGSHDQGDRNVVSVLVVFDLASGLATTLQSTEATDPVKNCDAIAIDRSFNHSPSWSADGTRLVFAREGAACPGAILTVNVDGSDLREVAHGTIVNGYPGLFMESGKSDDVRPSPVWSPDGSVIAVAAGGDIYAIRPDGSGMTALTTGGGSMWPTWTADGRIVFTRWNSTGDRRGDDWIIDSDGGNATRLEATIPALTAVGCLACTYPIYGDSGDPVIDPFRARQTPPLEMLRTTTMLWQP
jgi:hypothetical protein